MNIILREQWNVFDGFPKETIKYQYMLFSEPLWSYHPSIDSYLGIEIKRGVIDGF